jgi:hypothetical protein
MEVRFEEAEREAVEVSNAPVRARLGCVSGSIAPFPDLLANASDFNLIYFYILSINAAVT